MEGSLNESLPHMGICGDDRDTRGGDTEYNRIRDEMGTTHSC